MIILIFTSQKYNIKKSYQVFLIFKNEKIVNQLKIGSICRSANYCGKKVLIKINCTKILQFTSTIVLKY